MTKQFYSAEEVGIILGMSKPYAYKLIRRLNAELESRGLVTVPGKINKTYFDSRVLSVPNLEREVANVG